MNEHLFHLYAGETYYPIGGFYDYRGAFPTLDLAIRAMQSHHDWAHVVYNNEIVWTY